MPEDTKKRNKRQNEWKKANIERINLVFEKGTKERIQAAASMKNQSISEYVREAVREQLEKDGTKV